MPRRGGILFVQTMQTGRSKKIPCRNVRKYLPIRHVLEFMSFAYHVIELAFFMFDH